MVNYIYLHNYSVFSIRNAEHWELNSLKTLFIHKVREWEIVGSQFWLLLIGWRFVINHSDKTICYMVSGDCQV